MGQDVTFKMVQNNKEISMSSKELRVSIGLAFLFVAIVLLAALLIGYQRDIFEVECNKLHGVVAYTGREWVCLR